MISRTTGPYIESQDRQTRFDHVCWIAIFPPKTHHHNPEWNAQAQALGNAVAGRIWDAVHSWEKGPACIICQGIAAPGERCRACGRDL